MERLRFLCRYGEYFRYNFVIYRGKNCQLSGFIYLTSNCKNFQGNAGNKAASNVQEIQRTAETNIDVHLLNACFGKRSEHCLLVFFHFLCVSLIFI